MTATRLTPVALNRAAFSAFGDVIDIADQQPLTINYGQTLRYDDLAHIDVAEQGGRPVLSIFRSKPVSLPFHVEVLEYHPLSSQTFMPLHDRPFLVLVAPPGPVLEPAMICAFITNGMQGVSYHKGTWHHYQLSLEMESDYLVIDRGGAGDNCVESRLDNDVWIDAI